MRLTSFLFKKEGGKTRNKKEINRTDKRTTNKKKARSRCSLQQTRKFENMIQIEPKDSEI